MPEMTAEKWQRWVRRYLRAGYGTEDIAMMLKCDVSAVRLEVKILRESGKLREVLRLK